MSSNNDGSSFIAVRDDPGIPGDDGWQVLVKRGNRGPSGEVGPMARCRRGGPPAAYWDYECPIPRPDVYEYEKAALWEADLLAPEERSQLELEWHGEFEQAQAPDFWLCVGPGENLTGAAARRAWYRDRGIPRELIRRWSAARRRRVKTIRKLAKPEPV